MTYFTNKPLQRMMPLLDQHASALYIACVPISFTLLVSVLGYWTWRITNILLLCHAHQQMIGYPLCVPACTARSPAHPDAYACHVQMREDSRSWTRHLPASTPLPQASTNPLLLPAPCCPVVCCACLAPAAAQPPCCARCTFARASVWASCA